MAKKKNEIVRIRDEELEQSIVQKHRNISQKVTPKSHVKTRPDGYDYVDEAYMRNELTKEFPVWSWSPAGAEPVQFLGAEWVIVSGLLRIEDNGVLREFFSPGAARVQFARGKPHTAENVRDIDKNVASANTNAFKRAINRLGNVADDVYRKQDLTLSDEDIESIVTKMNGLSDEWKDRIMVSVENGGVLKTDLKKVINKIDQLTNEQEQANG